MARRLIGIVMKDSGKIKLFPGEKQAGETSAKIMRDLQIAAQLSALAGDEKPTETPADEA